MGSIVPISGFLFNQQVKVNFMDNRYKNYVPSITVTKPTNQQQTPYMAPTTTSPTLAPSGGGGSSLMLGGLVGSPTGGGSTNPGVGGSGGGTGGTSGGGSSQLPGNWETEPPTEEPWTGSGWDGMGYTGGGGMDGLPNGQGEEAYKVLAMDALGCPIYGYDKDGNPLYGRDKDGNVIRDPKVLPCSVSKKEGTQTTGNKSDRNFKIACGFIIAVAVGVAIFK